MVEGISEEDLIGLDDIGKYKILLDLKNIDYVYLIKDIKLRIKLILKVCKEPDISYYIYKQLMCINDDKIKIEYLPLLNTDYYIVDILSKLKCDNDKIKLLSCLASNYSRAIVMKTIKNDDLLLKYYKECCNELKLDVVLSLQNDTSKEELLNDFSIYERVSIIKSFSSDILKQKYSVLKEYSKFRSELMSNIKDENFLVEYFKDNKNIKFRLNLINKISDKDLKLKLTNILEESFYKEVIKSNNKSTKELLLSKININNINLDIPKDITIGVELEACNTQFKIINLLESVLDNWKIKEDASVNKGVEIISPILHFDLKSLKELYYVCNLMNHNNFYVDSSCGGHIHLGFDYIKTIEEFRIFLNIYGNTEDILYEISNRCGSKCRRKILKYAKPINDVLRNISNLNINYEKFNTLTEFTTLIQDMQPTRYFGLNAKNIGSIYQNTIEFRIPNGEIDFYELVNNIRLFAKILEKSKKLATTNNTNLINLYNKLINNSFDDKTKLNILLDILFDNKKEKEIYLNRYKSNTSKVKKLLKRKQNPINL